MNIYLAIIFGIVASFQLHIARCMQISGMRKLVTTYKKSIFDLPRIYIGGLILSNTAFIWIIAANRFAPPAVFTSMYGTGIIIIILYAKNYLNEQIKLQVYYGASLIFAGTLVIGLISDDLSHIIINRKLFLIFALVWVFIVMFAFLIYFLIKRNQINPLVSLKLGLLCGILGSMDPLLKGIGQTFTDTPHFLPQTSVAWVVFLSSLLFSTAAFIISQWSFAKGVTATTFISAFNSAYIGFPLLFRKLLTELNFSLLESTGLVMIVGGLFLMKNVNKVIYSRNK